MEPRRHLHVGENRFFKSVALAPPVPPSSLHSPASGNCKNFRSTPTSSSATDEFRELNFLMLTVGHAKSAWGALARCLHRFARFDIFTMRRVY